MARIPVDLKNLRKNDQTPSEEPIAALSFLVVAIERSMERRWDHLS